MLRPAPEVPSGLRPTLLMELRADLDELLSMCARSALKKQKDRLDVIASLDDTSAGFLRRGKVEISKGREHCVKAFDEFRRWCRSSQLEDASNLSAADADPLHEKFVEKKISGLDQKSKDLTQQASKIKANSRLVLEGLRELQSISNEKGKSASYDPMA